MMPINRYSASYAAEAGWRRIQSLLPEQRRLAPATEPTEEWLTIGRFSVHLDCRRRDEAPATLVLIHGGGGNGRLLAIYGAMAAAAGYEVVAPDLPGYGMTIVPSRHALVYDDWRRTAAAVLEAQARRSSRPIFIFGLSMGGMLAYDATALTRIPKGLVATCLLLPSDPQVRRSMARWGWMAKLIAPMLSAAPWLTDRLSVPMRLVGNMRAVANDRALADAIAADPRAGGGWMSALFLRTFVESEPITAPEAFDVCPVLLAHPADDRWTDISVSMPFFNRLNVEKRLVMLERAGHLPVEEPGATQLETALLHFLADHSRLPS
jgi:alpha-beta hydrolase superfamily lysophospholipase